MATPSIRGTGVGASTEQRADTDFAQLALREYAASGHSAVTGLSEPYLRTLAALRAQPEGKKLAQTYLDWFSESFTHGDGTTLPVVPKGDPESAAFKQKIALLAESLVVAEGLRTELGTSAFLVNYTRSVMDVVPKYVGKSPRGFADELAAGVRLAHRVATEKARLNRDRLETGAAVQKAPDAVKLSGPPVPLPEVSYTADENDPQRAVLESIYGYRKPEPMRDGDPFLGAGVLPKEARQDAESKGINLDVWSGATRRFLAETLVGWWGGSYDGTAKEFEGHTLLYGMSRANQIEISEQMAEVAAARRKEAPRENGTVVGYPSELLDKHGQALTRDKARLGLIKAFEREYDDRLFGLIGTNKEAVLGVAALSNPSGRPEAHDVAMVDKEAVLDILARCDKNQLQAFERALRTRYHKSVDDLIGRLSAHKQIAAQMMVEMVKRDGAVQPAARNVLDLIGADRAEDVVLALASLTPSELKARAAAFGAVANDYNRVREQAFSRSAGEGDFGPSKIKPTLEAYVVDRMSGKTEVALARLALQGLRYESGARSEEDHARLVKTFQALWIRQQAQKYDTGPAGSVRALTPALDLLRTPAGYTRDASAASRAYPTGEQVGAWADLLSGGGKGASLSPADRHAVQQYHQHFEKWLGLEKHNLRSDVRNTLYGGDATKGDRVATNVLLHVGGDSASLNWQFYFATKILETPEAIFEVQRYLASFETEAQRQEFLEGIKKSYAAIDRPKPPLETHVLRALGATVELPNGRTYPSAAAQILKKGSLSLTDLSIYEAYERGGLFGKFAKSHAQDVIAAYAAATPIDKAFAAWNFKIETGRDLHSELARVKWGGFEQAQGVVRINEWDKPLLRAQLMLLADPPAGRTKDEIDAALRHPDLGVGDKAAWQARNGASDERIKAFGAYVRSPARGDGKGGLGGYRAAADKLVAPASSFARGAAAATLDAQGNWITSFLLNTFSNDGLKLEGAFRNVYADVQQYALIHKGLVKATPEQERELQARLQQQIAALKDHLAVYKAQGTETVATREQTRAIGETVVFTFVMIAASQAGVSLPIAGTVGRPATSLLFGEPDPIKLGIRAGEGLVTGMMAEWVTKVMGDLSPSASNAMAAERAGFAVGRANVVRSGYNTIADGIYEGKDKKQLVANALGGAVPDFMTGFASGYLLTYLTWKPQKVQGQTQQPGEGEPPQDLQPIPDPANPPATTPPTEPQPVVPGPQPQPVVTGPQPQPVVTGPQPQPVVTGPQPQPVVTGPQPQPVVTGPQPQPVV
ncbi:MAG: DUF1720 domain-containing protein, partial [Myxococcota bacterium]